MTSPYLQQKPRELLEAQQEIAARRRYEQALIAKNKCEKTTQKYEDPTLNIKNFAPVFASPVRKRA